MNAANAIQAQLESQLPAIRRQRPAINPRWKPLTQALVIQRVLLNDILDPTTPKRSRAQLAKSWAILQECVREIRGIPKAGQFRPDLHPDQLLKAAKRAKLRAPIDIMSGAGSSQATFTEEPRQVESVTAVKNVNDTSKTGPLPPEKT